MLSSCDHPQKEKRCKMYATTVTAMTRGASLNHFEIMKKKKGCSGFVLRERKKNAMTKNIGTALLPL